MNRLTGGALHEKVNGEDMLLIFDRVICLNSIRMPRVYRVYETESRVQ
jgi:hypothetical protein